MLGVLKHTTFNLIIFSVFLDSYSNGNYTNALANVMKFGLGEEENGLFKLKTKTTSKTK